MGTPTDIDADQTRQITFTNAHVTRQIEVRFPTGGQFIAAHEIGEILELAVERYDAARTQLDAAPTEESLTAAAGASRDVIKQSMRLVRLVKGIMVNPDDYDWLMDTLADNRTDVMDVAAIIGLGMQAFANRDTRRAAAKKTRARTR
jgi:hypothetical protein